MAVLRDKRYMQFNFLLTLGDDNIGGAEAGFQECSGIGMEVTFAGYRNGREKGNIVRKITGMNKSSEVTLKGRVIASLNFYKWLAQIRNGNQNALRNVVIQLQNEDHTAVVGEWTLKKARIIRYTGEPLNAKGADVAMEELVLAYERIETA